MSARDLLAHVRARTLETMAVNPRPLFMALALASTLAIIFLAWPGELMDLHGYETLHRMHIADGTMIVGFAVHLAGMLRAVYAIVERPTVDKWVLRLGVFLFGVPPITVLLDLERPTLLGAAGLALAAVSLFCLVYRVVLPPARRAGDLSSSSPVVP